MIPQTDRAIEAARRIAGKTSERLAQLKADLQSAQSDYAKVREDDWRSLDALEEECANLQREISDLAQ